MSAACLRPGLLAVLCAIAAFLAAPVRAQAPAPAGFAPFAPFAAAPRAGAAAPAASSSS